MASYEEKKKDTEDYYQMLKDESYTALLDSQIQLDNARQRALKNMNSSLGAAGMQSSGYAGLVQNGIENQYISGLQNSQNQYNQQQLNIKQQERNALNALSDEEEQKNSGLQNTTAQSILNVLDDERISNDEKNNYLKQFGSFGQNGYSFNDDVNLNDMDKYTLQALANSFASEYAASQKPQLNEFKTTGLASYYRGDTLRTDEHVENVFANEIVQLQGGLQNGEIPANSYVVLNNGHDDEHLYLQIIDGVAYYMTKSEFEKNAQSYYEVKNRTSKLVTK